MKEDFIPPLEELAIPGAIHLPCLLVGEPAVDLVQRLGGPGAQVREPGLGLDLGQQLGQDQLAIGPVLLGQGIPALEQGVHTVHPQGRHSFVLAPFLIRASGHISGRLRRGPRPRPGRARGEWPSPDAAASTSRHAPTGVDRARIGSPAG